ncbi:hypothetical protein [Winslowiella iniecta]|uniref:hypothetical protein n=1 Tax=Winslowiella iniecta TaxID=1560201 RepID=UPI000A7C66BE|nr:hypothetical protein [Winslowiella iniecta]
MKNIQWFGGIVMVFAAALALFFSFHSVGNSASHAEPVVVVKEGTVLFSQYSSL